MITNYENRTVNIVVKDEAEALRLQAALKEAMQWFPKDFKEPLAAKNEPEKHTS